MRYVGGSKWALVAMPVRRQAFETGAGLPSHSSLGHQANLGGIVKMSTFRRIRDDIVRSLEPVHLYLAEQGD